MTTYAIAKAMQIKKKKGSKNMKKKFVLLLTLALMLTALAACGEQTENSSGGAQPPAASDSSGGSSDSSSEADGYPNKTVTVICPWGVGGGADTITRKITQVAEKYFDQPIIVENHTGASGTIGVGDAFDAPADGYTLVTANGPLFSLTPKYVDVQYTLDDFTMLRGMRTVSLMVVTNPKTTGFQSFDDILGYGKSHKLTYATSSGPGGDQYVVASAAFISMGIEAEPVVLGSEAEVVNAVASGQVDLGLCTPPSYDAFQEEGTALAVATFYPEDVETKFGTVKCMENWGIDAIFGGMDCLAIRSDTPQAIIDKLNAMLDEVYADPEFTGYLEEMGYNLWDAKGDEVQAFIENQMDSMERYVELLNAQ